MHQKYARRLCVITFTTFNRLYDLKSTRKINERTCTFELMSRLIRTLKFHEICVLNTCKNKHIFTFVMSRNVFVNTRIFQIAQLCFGDVSTKGLPTRQNKIILKLKIIPVVLSWKSYRNYQEMELKTVILIGGPQKGKLNCFNLYKNSLNCSKYRSTG